MSPTHDPTERYLQALIDGDADSLRSGFAGEPDLNDPMAGQVSGREALERFVKEKQAWLAEREARAEHLRTTRAEGRTVVENLLHVNLGSKPYPLPVGVVGVEGGDGKLKAIRVYHSMWPLIGGHEVRAALLPTDHNRQLSDVVAEYQEALATGNVEAIVNTFEPGGYFREPAGGDYFYRGRERLYEIMHLLLDPGGIPLEHCTVTDDGVACAIEFNAVKFGRLQLTPQAGLAVYERGASGRLCCARIYDDVNVEALAVQDK